MVDQTQIYGRYWIDPDDQITWILDRARYLGSIHTVDVAMVASLSRWPFADMLQVVRDDMCEPITFLLAFMWQHKIDHPRIGRIVLDSYLRLYTICGASNEFA